MVMDPGDAFCRMYPAWSLDADVNEIDSLRESFRVDIRSRADEIARTGGAVDRASSGTTEMFVELCAIDEALSTCLPSGAGGYSPTLAAVAALCAAEGRLNTSEDLGLLLPRWTIRGGPGEVTDRLADAFASVVFVAPAHAHHLSIRAVPPHADVPFGTRLRFAFAPVLTRVEDVRFESGTGLPGAPTAAWYSLAPDPAVVESQIDELIEAFDASGAHIALCPEAALSEPLLKVWQSRLRSVDRPLGSPLRFVLLGSGPFPIAGDPRPSNRAVVVHRDSGQVLLEHDKFAPFNFGVNQVESWGLDAQLPTTAPLHERIRRGTSSEMLESRVGRVAVLVCEDLTRHGEPVPDAVTAAAPSVLLVPIFAKAVRRYFWEEQAASRHATLFGTTVAVSNSSVVRDPVSGDNNFCLVARSDADPARWPDDVWVTDSPTVGRCSVSP